MSRNFRGPYDPYGSSYGGPYGNPYGSPFGYPGYSSWGQTTPDQHQNQGQTREQVQKKADIKAARKQFGIWQKDHCKGSDPFYTITWFRNHYCTRHNVARCDDCQKNYDKMSDKNMAAAEADKVTARPRDDGYEYFRSIYDQGTVEEKKQQQLEEEKQRRDREAQAQAQAQAQPAAGFNAGYAAPTPAPYDPPYITQPNLNNLAIPPSSRPAPPTQVHSYNIWLQFGLEGTPSRVTVPGDKTVRALVTEHGSKINGNLWLWSASRREWDTLYSFRTMRDLMEAASGQGIVTSVGVQYAPYYPPGPVQAPPPQFTTPQYPYGGPAQQHPPPNTQYAQQAGSPYHLPAQPVYYSVQQPAQQPHAASYAAHAAAHAAAMQQPCSSRCSSQWGSQYSSPTKHFMRQLMQQRCSGSCSSSSRCLDSRTTITKVNRPSNIANSTRLRPSSPSVHQANSDQTSAHEEFVHDPRVPEGGDIGHWRI
ncbi:hypothetical protein LTR56_005084 [Elasticomyces elasticus]|nr:hypothetical protein LTR22_026357 [Elasticomyces elasticus]KAK3652374.1 hypothetical protein LTR56_005084 [Elasticomyces elasticus]KAK4921242.1 hypothetical protein LTR49_011245 [Elasticomyces elasticus]KAK5748116.1 hypothetical protein LTS12_021851 [Elasticomyces elasticus]